MNKLIAAFIAATFAVGTAFAQAPAEPPMQNAAPAQAEKHTAKKVKHAKKAKHKHAKHKRAKKTQAVAGK